MLENKIKEGAKPVIYSLYGKIGMSNTHFIEAMHFYKAGAFSLEAKEYWQQGMWSEEDIKKLLGIEDINVACFDGKGGKISFYDFIMQNRKK